MLGDIIRYYLQSIYMWHFTWKVVVIRVNDLLLKCIMPTHKRCNVKVVYVYRNTSSLFPLSLYFHIVFVISKYRRTTYVEIIFTHRIICKFLEWRYSAEFCQVYLLLITVYKMNDRLCCCAVIFASFVLKRTHLIFFSTIDLSDCPSVSLSPPSLPLYVLVSLWIENCLLNLESFLALNGKSQFSYLRTRFRLIDRTVFDRVFRYIRTASFASLFKKKKKRNCFCVEWLIYCSCSIGEYFHHSDFSATNWLGDRYTCIVSSWLQINELTIN